MIYKGINILARRDRIVVQAGGINEMDGYKDDNETPDRGKAEAAVQVVAELYRRVAEAANRSGRPRSS